LVEENQGNVLQPSHLEAAMRTIWHQAGGSKGLTMASKGAEILFNTFTGIFYV